MSQILAYHVSTEKNLDWVNTNVCDDEFRDGLLYGARVASFTTTRYNGQLPDFSPYPRSYEEGEVGYRYQTRFNPDHFDKFLMARTTQKNKTQVHFLLLDNRNPRERVIAAFVRAYLRATDENFNEAVACARYFPNGQANDYARGEKIFVNVMFWHAVRVRPVRIDGEVATDGTHSVKKKGPTIRRTPFQDPTGWFDRLVRQLPTERREVEEEDDIDVVTRRMRAAVLHE